MELCMIQIFLIVAISRIPVLDKASNSLYLFSRQNIVNLNQHQLFKDPFLKLRKTYSMTELRFLLNKTQSYEIVVEPKVDGVSCNLEYKNGKLIRAFTKNYGKTGQLLNEYVYKIPKIPNKINNINGIIRGELFVKKEDFQEINNIRNKKLLKPYSCCRSAVVASMNNKNCFFYDKIQFFGYHINLKKIHNINRCFISQYDLHSYLYKLGFICYLHKTVRVFTRQNSAIKHIVKIKNKKIKYLTDIDGMILKPMNPHLANLALGYKFSLENRKSRIRSLVFKKIKNKKTLVLANINPIKFSNGRTIYRVYLDNINMISNLYKNDMVNIGYRSRPVSRSIVIKKRTLNSIRFKIPKLLMTKRNDIKIFKK